MRAARCKGRCDALGLHVVNGVERAARPLRILFTFEGPLPVAGYGGGHQILRGFARALVRMGHEVRILLGGSDEVGAARADVGVHYDCLELPQSIARPLSVARAALGIVRAWHPHVICCYTGEISVLAPACRVLGIVVVNYLAAPELLDVGFSIAGLRNARKSIGQFLDRLGTFSVHKVLTISEHTRRQAIATWRVPAQKVAAVGTGIDEAYTDLPVAPLERRRGTPLRLLSVGRIMLDQKPLDRVAEALHDQQVPWQHWTIVGRGGADDEAAFKARLSELGFGERVRWLGSLAAPAVRSELAQHDLVILPSRFESFFLTAYEALASQRMVLTNDVAELRTLIGESRALVFAEDQSAAAYRRALQVAWRHLEEYGSDEAVAARIRDRYAWDVVAARFLDVVCTLQKGVR